MTAAQTVPYKINFQGKLTNASGNALADGSYNMRLRLYSVTTGGTALWTETRETTNRVVVTNGLFNIQLGDVTALTTAMFSNGTYPLYLEIELPTPATATCSTASCQTWTEGAMTPRQTLASSPYAMNADTVDGIDGANLAVKSASNTFTGTNTFTQNVSVSGSLSVDTSIQVVDLAVSNTLRLIPLNSPPQGTQANGTIYYDNNEGKIIFTEGGTTKVLQDTPTLQNVYNASTSPASIITTAAKGIRIATGAAPTTDVFTITNAGQPVTTASVNGLAINYVGGAGAIESSAQRIDYAPGTTSGSTWNGLKIVANATGAASGVTQFGLNVDGPTTQGAGTEVALSIDANWDAAIDMDSKATEPGSPTGTVNRIYSQTYAGRNMLAQKTASGIAFAFQPALFEQSVNLLTGGSGTPTTIGTAWAANGTASASTPSETYGANTNYVSAATANSAAGVGQSTPQFYKGTVANGSNGFFYVARVAFPDANYGTGTTGSRIFVGLTSQTTINILSADTPTAGSQIGFQYSTNRGDTSWRFLAGNSGSIANSAVSMAFTTGKMYDFYIYNMPLSNTYYYRIDNLTDGTTASNSGTSSYTGSVAMRGVAALYTLTTTARNIMVNRVYIESDR